MRVTKTVTRVHRPQVGDTVLRLDATVTMWFGLRTVVYSTMVGDDHDGEVVARAWKYRGSKVLMKGTHGRFRRI